MGGKEEAKERELEWEQRNDRAGEELLGAWAKGQTEEGKNPNSRGLYSTWRDNAEMDK